MSVTTEIQKLKKRYPDSLSAVMPALQLAQDENGGWLSPDAIREVADALDLTPAYCLSIASFYDQYYLEPVGRTHVEVCTNVSCGLAGAQQVLEAFERELGVAPGAHLGRRGVHARHDRVPRRLRLGDRGRDRQPAPPARAGRRRPGDRRGAAQCLSTRVSCSPARTAVL